VSVDEPRALIDTAFGLLGSLHEAGSARVSELQRSTGVPRTTVHRLLGQLEQVGAVERSGRRWRLGPTMVTFGSGVPAAPRLRSVARRPLMDLANASGAHVTLAVEIAGESVYVEVLPGTRRLAYEPEPGRSLNEAALAEWGLERDKTASVRALKGARNGDLRPVVDVGGADARLSCAAAPLRISRDDVATVGVIVPGRSGVPAPLVEATRRTAAQIASRLAPAGSF